MRPTSSSRACHRALWGSRGIAPRTEAPWWPLRHPHDQARQGVDAHEAPRLRVVWIQCLVVGLAVVTGAIRTQDRHPARSIQPSGEPQRSTTSMVSIGFSHPVTKRRPAVLSDPGLTVTEICQSFGSSTRACEGGWEYATWMSQPKARADQPNTGTPTTAPSTSSWNRWRRQPG
jgi:hypothetical protein